MSHDGSLLDLHTVEFKRLLPGPIELAWDYLTKPELLKKWFADVSLEPQLGGAVEIRFTDGKGECGGVGAHGIIREFRRPHVIAFTWIRNRPQPDNPEASHDEGEVRFELAQKGDKVLLTLLHSRLPTTELPNYSGGWHAYIDNLESVISGRGPTDFMVKFHQLRPRYDERVTAMQRQGAA